MSKVWAVFFFLSFIVVANLGYSQVDTDEEIAEEEELVYDDIDSAEGESEEFGMLGVVEGTIPDAEEVFILDDDTLFTNEVEISPSWCE
jgi:hypothetical protein